MVFQVPASKASVKQNRFEFQIPGEKKPRSLPKLQYISAEQRHRIGQVMVRVQAARGEDGEGAVDPADAAELDALQHEMLEQYSPGLYAAVDSEQVQAIVKAWSEASSVSLGESTASVDS